MKKPNLISKTVRLPDYLVDYIEQQPGDTFTNKLCNLVEDCLHGDEDRQARLDRYKRQVAQYESMYTRLVNTYMDANRTILHMTRYLDDLKELAASCSEDPELQEPEPEDPDLVPGVMPFT